MKSLKPLTAPANCNMTLIHSSPLPSEPRTDVTAMAFGAAPIPYSSMAEPLAVRPLPLFGEKTAVLSDQTSVLRERFWEYFSKIPTDRGDLASSHPKLYKAIKKTEQQPSRPFGFYDESVDALSDNIFYLGAPDASRVIVSLTGAPLSTGYLVPFFQKVADTLSDRDTAFLILPYCHELEAPYVLWHLQRIGLNLKNIGFFTHSGGSLTLHQLQKDGYFPRMTSSFAALAWVYRHDYDTLAPEDYKKQEFPLPETFTAPETGEDFIKHGGLGLFPLREIFQIGNYYFPDFIWQDYDQRQMLWNAIIQKMPLRRTIKGLDALAYWKTKKSSFVPQVRALARRKDLRILAFSGSDDDIVSATHARKILARLSGINIGDIPQEEPWQKGSLEWHPIIGGKHIPIFEHSDKMAIKYAEFLQIR